VGVPTAAYDQCGKATGYPAKRSSPATLAPSSSEPRVDIREAIAAVQVLEALQRSLERDGVPEPVGGSSEEPVTGRVIPLPAPFKANAGFQDG